jgi:hypothetical protein
MVTPWKCGLLSRGDGLGAEHRVGGAEVTGDAREAASDALGFYGTPSDPALWLPLRGDRPSRPTRIVRITPADQRWTIAYARDHDADLTTTTIELDPKFDWHVTRMAHQRVDGFTYDVRSTLQRLPDATIAVAESYRVQQGKESGGRVESRLRAMSHDEQRELKTTVERMLRKRWSARSLLMRPEIVGIGWPAAGALMLAMARYTSTRSKRTRPSTLRAK